MLRRFLQQTGELETATTDSGGGSVQSLDHMANWVRFADTKATILAAGLGVALTMLMSNAKVLIEAMIQGWGPGLLVGGTATAALAAFVWTLYWLVRAIGPQRSVRYAHLNRFAWPSLVGVTKDQLIEHVAQVDIDTDAWQQVLDLAGIADRKFEACSKAVTGFACLIILGLITVTAATAVNM